MKKTILAAVDSSERSSFIYKEALVLASTLQADVIVMSVTPEYEGNMNRFCIDNAEEEFNKPFLSILQDASEYAESLGLNIKTVHRKGKPGHDILAVAEKYNVSLIVLGCSKRHQVERLLSGRTVAEVIANSACDIFLIPDNSEIRFNNILVGLDASPRAQEAVKRAFDVAASYGSKVHGLHAISLPSDRSLRYGVASDAEKAAAPILDSFTKLGIANDIPVTAQLCWNTEEKCIYSYSQEHDIDLVVLGAISDKSIVEAISGSLVEKLSSLTSCPLLIAKASDGSASHGDNSIFSTEIN